MGKRKELDKARKEVFNERVNEISPVDEDAEEEYEKYLEYEDLELSYDNSRYKMCELFLLIKNYMLDNNLEIGEYLTSEDVEDFIENKLLVN